MACSWSINAWFTDGLGWWRSIFDWGAHRRAPRQERNAAAGLSSPWSIFLWKENWKEIWSGSYSFSLFLDHNREKKVKREKETREPRSHRFLSLQFSLPISLFISGPWRGSDGFTIKVIASTVHIKRESKRKLSFLLFSFSLSCPHFSFLLILWCGH